MAVPLFANPAIASIGGLTQPGLFYGGGSAAAIWLLLQIVGVLISTVFIFVASWGFVKVASTFMAVRASVTEEIQGLDLADHGISAEVDDVPAAAPVPA
jgi:Amt family ammonium transporter